MSEERSDFEKAKVKLCSLWLNTAKDGTEYLAGYIGDAKMMIFPNRFKETEKQPSHNLFLLNKVRKKEPESVTPEGDHEQIKDLPF